MHARPRFSCDGPLDYNPEIEARVVSGPYRKWPHRNPASSPASPMALVSSHGWFGILGTGWRCVAWPRRHAEIMERKRDAASMPVHRSQTAPDSTPIWRDYSCNIGSGHLSPALRS